MTADAAAERAAVVAWIRRQTEWQGDRAGIRTAFALMAADAIEAGEHVRHQPQRPPAPCAIGEGVG